MLKAILGLWPLIVLVVVALCAYVLLRRFGLLPKGGDERGPGGDDFGYRRHDSLLSRGELAFFQALVPAVGDRFVVMVKVGLMDLVTVDNNGPGETAAFNRIRSGHVDFVLCTPDAIAPVLAVELDDASHDSASRMKRDERKNQILASAGLPLLRIRAATGYVPSEIRRRIEAKLSSAPSTRRPVTVPGAP